MKTLEVGEWAASKRPDGSAINMTVAACFQRSITFRSPDLPPDLPRAAFLRRC